MTTKTTIPFQRAMKNGKTKPLWNGRKLTIDKDRYTEGEPANALVNFTVEWNKDDPRAPSILSGASREQNVFVDARSVLLALQNIFPELNISFDDSVS